MTLPSDESSLARLYRQRFTDSEIAFKEQLWRVLCRRVFQQYVGANDTVLDLGAGRCEFINAIRCARKIAVDLNPDTRRYARDAQVIQAHSTDMAPVRDGTVDVVFTSNFLEHLPDKESVLKTLAECHRITRAGGTLIVLMPNIRYLPGRYWDYFDHHVPLTHLSLAEALSISGFRPVRLVPRFLPYTVKQGRIPRSPLLVEVYLRLPVLWPLLGRQMLAVSRRESP